MLGLGRKNNPDPKPKQNPKAPKGGSKGPRKPKPPAS